MAVNRIQFFAPTGPHLKAPSLERRFFFASALFYLHSILRLMRNGELTATPHSDHLTAFLGQDRDVPIIRADRGISAAEQLMQCCGEPDMSIIMYPAVIIRSAGPVDAAGGLSVQKTERAQLRLTDGHGCYP
jgi:hypothetical protein